MAAVAFVGWPAPADALVAIRPSTMAPFAAEEHIRARFGGRPDQWVVLSTGADLEEARTRADRVAEALEPLQRAGTIDGFDALGTFAPSANTERARLAERDTLDLPARRSALEDALRGVGFDAAAFAPALAAFAHPSSDLAAAPAVSGDVATWLLARHAAVDEGGALVATYAYESPALPDRRRSGPRRGLRHRAQPPPITGFDTVRSRCKAREPRPRGRRACRGLFEDRLRC